MLVENLMRAELSPAERAKATARRKAVYLKLHPETAHGGNRTASRQLGDLPDPERFTAETAAASGRSERAVQRDNERGEKVTDAALDKVAGTPLDSGAYLDRLKDVPAVHRARSINAYLPMHLSKNMRSCPTSACLS
jgi:hypothetical protein